MPAMHMRGGHFLFYFLIAATKTLLQQPNQRDDTNRCPCNVKRGRGPRPVPAAIQNKSGRTDDVHPLERCRLAGQFAGRNQQIGSEDEQRRCPSNRLDRRRHDSIGITPPACAARTAGCRR